MRPVIALHGGAGVMRAHRPGAAQRKALESRGEIRGGRFIAGIPGEQYALPEAVGLLRETRRRKTSGNLVSISAADPLNLVGILTPGARLPALTGNRVLFEDGAAHCWGRNQLGQLGAGLPSTEAVSQVDGEPRIDLGARSSRVDAGGDFTCALITPARELVCFGDDTSGQLGHGPRVGPGNLGDDEVPSSAGPVPLF